MALSVDQIFVKTSNLDDVTSLLHSYVEEYRNQFIATSKVKLDGIKQVLTNLVKKRRNFQLLDSENWISIWEIIHDSEITDPAISKYLSNQVSTESIWTSLDCNYNIWAYQIFQNGKLIEELFEPKSYFIDDDPESEHSEDYGFCLDQAEKFNKKHNLPYFMETMSTIKRKPTIFDKLVTVTCKIT